MFPYTYFEKRLARGYLKNLPAVDDKMRGEIREEEKETVLDLTNQGLEDLYTRKPLLKRYVDLVFKGGQSRYPLVSGTDYLEAVDEDVFNDQLIKVISIQNSEGKNFTPDTDGHVMTPTYDELRFSQDFIDEYGPRVRIQYQSKIPLLTREDTIKIPPSLLQALLLFVASKYTSQMNGPEHSRKGESYFVEYLRAIDGDTIQNNSSASEVQEDTRLEDRGFV